MNLIKTTLVNLILFCAATAVMSAAAAQNESPGDPIARLVDAAIERTTHRVCYDGKYLSIPYPGGDVPDSIGVCTDLVIRSYRSIGIDLQKEVHEDMSAHFALYPNNWGLRKPDANIDHRRVPNLQVFFARYGTTLLVSNDPDDYKTGDLVTWILWGNQPHIGIVTDKRSRDGKRPLVVHNIGAGPAHEDVLFEYDIDGHFRYFGQLENQR